MKSSTRITKGLAAVAVSACVLVVPSTAFAKTPPTQPDHCDKPGPQCDDKPTPTTKPSTPRPTTTEAKPPTTDTKPPTTDTKPPTTDTKPRPTTTEAKPPTTDTNPLTNRPTSGGQGGTRVGDAQGANRVQTDPIPQTGSNSRDLAGLGLGLVGAGAAASYAARRRVKGAA